MTFLKPYNYCYYCRCPMDTKDTSAPHYETRDHKQPKSRGGAEDCDNVVPCCKQCNQTKGNMTEAEYVEYRRRGRPNKIKYLREIGLIK